jgi:hypothetical protein
MFHFLTPYRSLVGKGQERLQFHFKITPVTCFFQPIPHISRIGVANQLGTHPKGGTERSEASANQMGVPAGRPLRNAGLRSRKTEQEEGDGVS